MKRVLEYLANKLPLRMIITVMDIFINNYPRIEIYNNAFTYALASNVIGDYLEFGVFGGKTFSLAYHHAIMRGFTGRFIALDSFDGLPDGARDYDMPSNTLHAGQFASPIDEFRKKVAAKGVDLARVRTVKGWFNESLTTELKKSLRLERAAVIMVDCDLYESAVPVLEFITDILVPGSVLMFDDWFLYEGNPEHGVQAATNEWLVLNPQIHLIEYHKFGWHGNSFIVRIS